MRLAAAADNCGDPGTADIAMSRALAASKTATALEAGGVGGRIAVAASATGPRTAVEAASAAASEALGGMSVPKGPGRLRASELEAESAGSVGILAEGTWKESKVSKHK